MWVTHAWPRPRLWRFSWKGAASRSQGDSNKAACNKQGTSGVHRATACRNSVLLVSYLRRETLFQPAAVRLPYIVQVPRRLAR